MISVSMFTSALQFWISFGGWFPFHFPKYESYLQGRNVLA